MSEKSFKFIFDGPAFAEHQIDVADLAPALLALGNIVKRANQAINGDRAEARLMVKATAEGSFDAILSIDVSFLSAMVDMIDYATGHKERIATAKELTDLLINMGTMVIIPLTHQLPDLVPAAPSPFPVRMDHRGTSSAAPVVPASRVSCPSRG